MRNWLNNLLFPNRIKGVYQFLDKDRKPHIYIFTSNKVVELDYDGSHKRTAATLKQIKEAKAVEERA